MQVAQLQSWCRLIDGLAGAYTVSDSFRRDRSYVSQQGALNITLMDGPKCDRGFLLKLLSTSVP